MYLFINLKNTLGSLLILFNYGGNAYTNTQTNTLSFIGPPNSDILQIVCTFYARNINWMDMEANY